MALLDDDAECHIKKMHNGVYRARVSITCEIRQAAEELTP